MHKLQQFHPGFGSFCKFIVENALLDEFDFFDWFFNFILVFAL